MGPLLFSREAIRKVLEAKDPYPVGGPHGKYLAIARGPFPLFGFNGPVGSECLSCWTPNKIIALLRLDSIETRLRSFNP